jgi:hypothetical protein
MRKFQFAFWHMSTHASALLGDVSKCFVNRQLKYTNPLSTEDRWAACLNCDRGKITSWQKESIPVGGQTDSCIAFTLPKHRNNSLAESCEVQSVFRN